jgi:hypothetical protein
MKHAPTGASPLIAAAAPAGPAILASPPAHPMAHGLEAGCTPSSGGTHRDAGLTLGRHTPWGKWDLWPCGDMRMLPSVVDER